MCVEPFFCFLESFRYLLSTLRCVVGNAYSVEQVRRSHSHGYLRRDTFPLSTTLSYEEQKRDFENHVERS